MTGLKWMNWHEWLERNELPKVLRDPHFFTIFTWNRALARVSCTFCRPHLQKVVRTCRFFTIFMFNRALATVPCTFCRPLSGLRRATAETDTLKRRPRTATLPEKNIGFCARECFQPWTHVFLIAHTSQLLNDDVIDMMMWLTWWLRWWCGCHDGETANHWQSSVTGKFPN